MDLDCPKYAFFILGMLKPHLGGVYMTQGRVKSMSEKREVIYRLMTGARCDIMTFCKMS